MSNSWNVSAVITCKDRLDHLKITLKFWEFQEKEVEVVVVDYGCSQNCSEWVRENYPKFRTVRVDTDGWNISHARNVGAVHATGNAIAFSDADLIVPEDYISRAVQKLEDGNDLVCISHYSYDMVRLLNGQCVVRADMFHKVRGYDESTEHYSHEDIRFYREVESAGGKVGYVYNAYLIPHDDKERLKHYPSGEMKEIRERQIAWLLEERENNPNGYGQIK